MDKNNLTVKCCENCIKWIPVGIHNDILCRDKGIVSSDFYCPGFREFQMDSSLQKQLDYRCSDCTFFTFTQDSHNKYYGVCSRYCYREIDGSVKKACSKFEKKSSRTA